MTYDKVYIVLGLLALPSVLRLVGDLYLRPYRLQLAKLGARILEDPEVTESQKTHVEISLCNAFSMWMGVIASILVTPCLIVMLVMDIRSGGKLIEKMEKPDSIYAHALGDDFVRLSSLCHTWANPLSGLIISIQLLILKVVLRPLFLLLRNNPFAGRLSNVSRRYEYIYNQ